MGSWKITASPPVQAALLPGSCAPSKHLEKFLPIKGKVIPRDDGILVRFLLDAEGSTFGIKVEETHPAPVNVATAYIQSCRTFNAAICTPASRDSGHPQVADAADAAGAAPVKYYGKQNEFVAPLRTAF